MCIISTYLFVLDRSQSLSDFSLALIRQTKNDLNTSKSVNSRPELKRKRKFHIGFI